MKVSREEAGKNRKRVVSVAGELFREHGFDGIGIADLMKKAGLTHGGFYKQFASKQHLQAEASADMLAENASAWSKVTSAKDEPLKALVDFYLSPLQRRMMKNGCAMAALGADAARHNDAVQSVFTKGIETHLQQLQDIVPGETDAKKRRTALSALSEMVGALILARAVDDDDLAGELLDAARDDITSRLGD